MALDLIFGATSRRWSIGLTERRRRQLGQDVLAERAVGDLAKTVEEETFKNFQTNLRLSTQGKLPVPLRRSFGALLRRWYAFRDEHRGRYAGEDFVALQNFRDENRIFTRRLAELDATPASRARAPEASPSPNQAGSHPSLAPMLGVAAALGGLALLASRRGATFGT